MLDVTGSRLGSNSEVGALRVVILHRPGAELQRLTPRNNDELLFDGLPWVARAQEEHDAFADLLRSRGVEVLLAVGPADRGAGQRRGPDAGHRGGGRFRSASGLPLAQELSAYLRGRSTRPRWRMC